MFAFIDKLSSIYQYIISGIYIYNISYTVLYIYDTYSNVMGGLLKAEQVCELAGAAVGPLEADASQGSLGPDGSILDLQILLESLSVFILYM